MLRKEAELWGWGVMEVEEAWCGWILWEPPPFLFQRKERQGEEVASEGMKKNAIVSDRTIREVDREANYCLREKG